MINRFYIHVLVILAIVMVGISPACAFISGKSSLLQICAADGSVQTIEVDAAFDPFAEPVPMSEHLEAMEQCSYCFAVDHHKYGELRSLSLSLNELPQYLKVSSGVSVPFGVSLTLYQPRGPPQAS